MRKYTTNLAFSDLLMNILLGFAVLFILAFMLINPIADEGKIDPEVKVMITLKWDNQSTQDMDLWVRGPDGTTVGYRHKDGSYILLDRDDLGGANDKIVVNGEERTIARNIETVVITDLQDGEYVVNVHFFSGRDDEVVVVDLMEMTPFAILFSGDATLDKHKEMTIVSFLVEEGEIVDIRTDIQMSLRRPSPDSNAYQYGGSGG